MALVDSVQYGISDPWPEIQSNSGFTLSLIDPDMDNALAASWEVSRDRLGTPGGSNDFTLDQDPGSTPVHEDLLFQNSPNPFSHYTRIVFHSGRVQPVLMTVYDLNGRIVKVLANRIMDPGYHEIEWIPERAADGIYLLRVETPGSVYTRKMIKHR